MTEAELAALANLPEEVTIFRGCYARNKRGLSWSLDATEAAKFPFYNRYRQLGQPLLIRGKVRRDSILALKLDREELEVIAERPKIEAIRHIRGPSERVARKKMKFTPDLNAMTAPKSGGS